MLEPVSNVNEFKTCRYGSFLVIAGDLRLHIFREVVDIRSGVFVDGPRALWPGPSSQLR